MGVNNELLLGSGLAGSRTRDISITSQRPVASFFSKEGGAVRYVVASSSVQFRRRL